MWRTVLDVLLTVAAVVAPLVGVALLTWARVRAMERK